jgi:hypothetical protein
MKPLEKRLKPRSQEAAVRRAALQFDGVFPPQSAVLQMFQSEQFTTP